MRRFGVNLGSNPACKTGRGRVIGILIDSPLPDCILRPLCNMPYIPESVTVKRTFVPPEAGRIAARWRGIAKEIREIALNLRSIGDSLNTTWEGTSQERFMAEYSSLPGNVEGCADLLDSLASQVASTTVTEEVEVTRWVWDPGI